MDTAHTETQETQTQATVDAAQTPASESPHAPAPAQQESDVDAFARGVAEAKAADTAAAAPAADPAQSPAAAPTPAPAVASEDDEDLSDEDRQRAEIEAEVSALGLKEKTAERFRELASRPTQQAYDEIAAKAARADEWQNAVAATRATPEQFGRALSYLQAINSGDPKSMSQMFDAMVEEMKWLGSRIGKEVPGFHDPLEAHRDLAKDVSEGTLPRGRALEIAQQREFAARSQELSQRQQAEQQHQQQFQEANDQATAALQVIGARLRASDPAFSQKMAYLQPTLQVIQQSMHPSQWATAAERAYLSLPSIATAPAPAPKPAVGAVPLRPTGSATTQVRQPKDDMEAFSMGVASVR